MKCFRGSRIWPRYYSKFAACNDLPADGLFENVETGTREYLFDCIMTETKKETMPISTENPDSVCDFVGHLTTKELKEWGVGDLPIIIPIGYAVQNLKIGLFTKPSKLK